MPEERKTFRSKLKFRSLFLEHHSNRVELEGTFTATDLRNIADWLDNPEHPTNQFWQPEIKLSPIVHE